MFSQRKWYSDSKRRIVRLSFTWFDFNLILGDQEFDNCMLISYICFLFVYKNELVHKKAFIFLSEFLVLVYFSVFWAMYLL
jgi:hypothetical protein